MGRLNQVIAVVAPKKKQAMDTITEAYHKIQKAELFNGISKTYTPREEDGDKLPSESKNVQAKCHELIEMARGPMQEMLDVVATQDYANCLAKAAIVVDGHTVIEACPVTHMLFLEKQLVDLKTFVSKLPTLDPGEDWQFDENADCYASKPSETTRSKKIPKPFVKYEATKEHPAQVDLVHDDVLVGNWKTIKFSGAMPAKEKNELIERVRRLQEAVIKAREEANSMEVEQVKTGGYLLNYVFGVK